MFHKSQNISYLISMILLLLKWIKSNGLVFKYPSILNKNLNLEKSICVGLISMRIITLRDTYFIFKCVVPYVPTTIVFKTFSWHTNTNGYNLWIMINSNTFVCCNHLRVIAITLALDRIIRHISLDFLILDIKMI